MFRAKCVLGDWIVAGMDWAAAPEAAPRQGLVFFRFSHAEFFEFAGEGVAPPAEQIGGVPLATSGMF